MRTWSRLRASVRLSNLLRLEMRVLTKGLTVSCGLALLLALATGGCAKSPAAPDSPPPATGPGNVPPPPPPIPQLLFTKFLAFGDSITEGKDPDTDMVLPYANSYPGLLQAMMTSRYSLQTVGVINEGCGGEEASETGDELCIDDGLTLPMGGEERLPAVLRADSPQVLLLQEGINDLSDQGLGGIGALVDALTNMVMEARGNGVQHVFLATLLPARDGARATNTELIPSMNDDIRLVAGNTGATLVDLYAAFGGTADPAYIGNDGLHPTELGYQLIAQTFLNAIEATVEAPPTASPSSTAP
jgi:lysophospholipase L1-like esterase